MKSTINIIRSVFALFASACFAALFISAITPAVAGEMVPFNGTVSGYINALPSDVVNFGHANQLGAFTGTADFYPNPPDPVSGCFTYTGFFHWVAANGDKLEGTFEGILLPDDAGNVRQPRNCGRGPHSQHRSLCRRHGPF